MATMIGSEAHVVDMLIHLVELDFDAIAAYRAAIERLDSPRPKRAMQEFLLDHERHIRELSPLIRELGGTPPLEGDLKSVLTKGKVVIGQLMGDAGILGAMRSNEDDTNDAYERAASRIDAREPVRLVLARGLADERRHRGWIEAELERLRRLQEAQDTDEQPGTMPQTAI